MPSLDATQVLLLAVIGVVSCIPVALVVRGRHGGAREWPLAVTVTVTTAVAVLLGHVAFIGWPRWGSWQHQPAWIGLISLPLGIGIAARAGERTWVRRLVGALAAAALGWIVIAEAIDAEWTPVSTGVGWTLVLSLLAFLVLTTSLDLAARLRAATLPSTALVTVAGAVTLCLLSHYAKFALVGSVLIASLAPVTVALLTIGRTSIGPGPVLVVLTVTLSLLLGGFLHSLAEDRVAAPWFLLTGTAPLWAALPGPASEQESRGRALLRVALVAIPVLTAIAAALLGASAEPPADPASEWEY